MVKNNHKSTKEQLENVQSLILENLYLQDKYPERKFGLKLSLESLRDLESEMFEALKQEQVNKKLEIYEMRLEGMSITNGSMSMKEYGKILIDSQEVITSFAEDKPLSLNQSPSINTRNVTQMDVFAQCNGSLRILLISKQSKLDNDENNSLINIALKKLNKLSSSGENLLETIKKENIGKKQILTYKNLMESLYSMNINMEIKKPVKNNSDEILCDIDTYKSYKMFNLITEKHDSKKETKQVTGIIKAVDLDKGKFKIESKFGDKTEIITSDFHKNYEEFMVKNLNKEITVELKNITEDFVDKNPSSIYELSEIID